MIARAKRQAIRIGRAGAQRALIASALASALVATSGPLVAQSWVELGREISCTVWFDPQSIRKVDPDVIEIVLLYEGPVAPGWEDDHRPRVWGCDLRIETVRIRCGDKSYQITEILEMGPGNTPLQADGVFPSWRPRDRRAWFYPPGWRRDVHPATTYAAVHAAVCATTPP